jgi:hypothetical protein
LRQTGDIFSRAAAGYYPERGKNKAETDHSCKTVYHGNALLFVVMMTP